MTHVPGSLITGTVMVFVAVLLGCSSIENYSGTVATSSAKEIEQSLTEAAKPLSVAASAPPATVFDALIPAPGGPQTTDIEERFDITVDRVPAAEFFMGLVTGTPYNMVVHPAVEGKITLDLKNVTLSQVLEVSRRLYGYDFKDSNGIYKVFPAGVRTRVFQINYLDINRSGISDILVSSGQLSTKVSGSGDGNSGRSGSTSESTVLSRITTETNNNFWQGLQETISTIIGDGAGRKVITNSSAGIVLVKAYPDELEDVADYLQRSQLTMQRQVVLEAKILEVTLNEGFSQGINWEYFNDLSNDVDADGNPLDFVRLGLSSEVVTSALGGIFSTTLSINNFTGFIELLATQGSVQVLSSPRIATINNQKAVIKVGSDEFFVTGIETTRDEDSDETTDVEITPFFSGIALDVTPQIGDDDTITLHVHPTISQVEDQTKTIVVGGQQIILPLALSTVRETDSVVKARDGQVIVIGGLIRNVTQDDQAEVPFLGDIPILGEAFTQKRQSEQKSELVILIKPTLVAANSFQEDLLESRQRVQTLREQIENDYTKQPASNER